MAKNSDDRKQNSHKICSNFLQGPWKNISVEEVKFTELKGGLMNDLFHCALPDSALIKDITTKKDIPEEVLIRFYGPQQENTEVLVREVTIFTMLSERNIGPKLYGVFANGRLEQYLPSKSTSTWHDFSDIYIDVAKEIAKYHSLNMPIKKMPSALEDLVNRSIIDIKKIAELNSPESCCEIIVNGEFEREFTWLMKAVKKLGAKIVFCHNDVQGGNILLLNNPLKDLKKRIVFIDYEFSAYNYRGYDIASFFLTKCVDLRPAEIPNTFKYDLTKFPTKEEQENFVDAYLDQLQESNKIFNNDLQKEEEKQKILEEISLLRLGSCLGWTIITLKVQLNPHNEFPFWEIGKKAWETYKKFKDEILQDKKLNII